MEWLVIGLKLFAMLPTFVGCLAAVFTLAGAYLFAR